ncbi:MAG: dTDP-4-dehydrorhamnose reductase [Patescibacteria group bacterium]|nr:dTDP-4-dehydrorhamnose reductase [Patescibacteria group bacterium]
MKVLIIGAKGMLGQELVQIFGDHEVIAWDREDCDIANKDEIQAKIRGAKPDVIINAAAYNDVDGAEKNKEIADLINGRAPCYLAEAAEALGAIMVHYSTDYVFRGDNKEGYGEDDRPDPQSVYATSKYLGELELAKYCTKFYLIRLSRLFGRAAAGEGAKKSFVDKMLELAQTKSELDLIDEEVSSPTYAPDLAKRTREIIDGKKGFGIYHGANRGSCTWYGFAEAIFKTKGIDIKLNPVPAGKFPRPAARPAFSVLLNTKLPEARTWQEALWEYLASF